MRCSSLLPARRSFAASASPDKVAKVFNQLPWNFNAHLRNMEVQSLEAPVDLQRACLTSVQATTLFKEFVSAICENDMSLISDRMEPSMRLKMEKKVDEAHATLAKNGLQLRAQHLRGSKGHDSEFFLYNVKTYMLCGGVSLDRSLNKPVTSFMKEEDEEATVNGKIITLDQIAKIDDHIGLQASNALVIMRLNFIVHSFINMYVWDEDAQAEIVGFKVKERNLSTKQSHLMTLDKIVCEIPLQDTFVQDQVDMANIKNYGTTEGLMISDFDDFMPRGNPIVNFQPVWPPEEDTPK